MTKRHLYIAEATGYVCRGSKGTISKQEQCKKLRYFLYYDLGEGNPKVSSSYVYGMSFEFVAGYLKCAFATADENPENLEIHNGIPKDLSAYRHFAECRTKPLANATLERLLQYSHVAPAIDIPMVHHAS